MSTFNNQANGQANESQYQQPINANYEVDPDLYINQLHEDILQDLQKPWLSDNEKDEMQKLLHTVKRIQFDLHQLKTLSKSKNYTKHAIQKRNKSLYKSAKQVRDKHINLLISNTIVI